MLRFRIAALVVTVGCFVACASPATAQDNAVIKGKAIFGGDAADPAYKRKVINTQKDPNCKKNNKKKIGSENVIINKKTDPMTLRNVLVSIDEGLGDTRKFPAKIEPFVLDQFGCQHTGK